MVILPIVVSRYGSSRIAVEARLRSARAVSPASAVAFRPTGPTDFAGLEEAIGRGRIVRATNGKLFLNSAAIPEPRFGGAMAIPLFLLSAGSVIASVVMLVRFAAR